MNVTIAAAQYPITEHQSWSDWQTHTEGWVSRAVEQRAQLLVFPEYGSMELVSLFSEEIRQDIRRQVREMDALKADFCQTFADLARKYQVSMVAPSFPELVGKELYNRAYVFSPKGLVGYQDKFFMTRFENEEWGIASAPKYLSLFEADWGTFGIQICYDSEFSISSRLLCSLGASLIVAPSCTETIRGATRVHVGCRARALENQCYTVVSQTVGTALWSPAVDVNYGFAAFYSTPDKGLPEEGIIATHTPQAEEWLIQTLDLSKIEEVRSDGHVFNFKDHKQLHMGFMEDQVKIRRYTL